LELGPCIEGDWSAESAFAAAVTLLEREPRDFTAIVAANVHMALSVLRALLAKGDAVARARFPWTITLTFQSNDISSRP
jgi:DNA-binding LacI/PurR family transcriptional regulator